MVVFLYKMTEIRPAYMTSEVRVGGRPTIITSCMVWRLETIPEDKRIVDQPSLLSSVFCRHRNLLVQDGCSCSSRDRGTGQNNDHKKKKKKKRRRTVCGLLTNGPTLSPEAAERS